MDKIKKLAKELGHDSVEYIGEWKQFKIFIPYTKDDDTIEIVGLPQYILEKGNIVRFSTPDEVFDIMDDLLVDEED